MTSLRQCVFNVMPIHMLAFDSSGSGIRLVDHNEVIKLVFQEASVVAVTSEFLNKFQATYYMFRDNMINKLVQDHSRYAILSHTWIQDAPGDVVFGDWHSCTENPQGYCKIAKFCEVAAKHHEVTLG